ASVFLHCEESQLCLVGGTEAELEAAVARLKAMLETTESYVGISRIQPADGYECRRVQEAKMASHGWFLAADRHVSEFDNATSENLAAVIRSLQLAIQARDSQLIRQILGRIPLFFLREGLGMFHVQELWNQAVMAASAYSAEAAPVTLSLQHYETLAAEFSSLREMCNYLADALEIPAEASDSMDVQDSFQRLYEYVRANYCQKLTLGDLTRRFYLTPTYCCELFKSKTGRTLSEFITCLRMERAAEIMGSGSETLQAISGLVGYGDYFHFSKMFKKYFGVSPKQYVKENRKHGRTGT
nr:AraC family transcriptional regulator [Clostridia bacterium]